MTDGHCLPMPSVFRTRSWVQAWIDTWGKHPGVELIDLGGRRDPLEILYRTTIKLKRWLPAKTLCLAGTGAGAIHTPRSEYNHMNELMQQCGGEEGLRNALTTLSWSQFILPDILIEAPCYEKIRSLSKATRWPLYIERDEPAYCIESPSFKAYCDGLSGSTRRRYFHQRQRLESQSGFLAERWPQDRIEPFIHALNQLHISRWGKPCYSPDSIRFLLQFTASLEDEGGTIVLDVLKLEGVIVSVLFDIIWKGTRYNLQSGYVTSGTTGLSLGALHLGYGIEEAVKSGQRYDCLAGQGKHTDYKRHIANKKHRLQTVILQKPSIATLRTLNSLFSTGK
ncbi:GNAT family N-acetyltransferase [Marinimicrobium sp. LS-A18]|uniref:GNAT family N-acetyltransferase n=1 Tax=Marinimicrobium sp. LS-A18 TaxID=1381596 RepID=UPI0009DBC3DD|nr:GNAT family N-acetyltransferase [Marinimicrobium sp. LS-A18]